MKKYVWMTIVAGGLALNLSSWNSEKVYASCVPTEEEIEAYKEDGTWEERQEYVDALEYDHVSERLLYEAIQRENGAAPYNAGENIPEDWKGTPVTGDARVLAIQVDFQDVTFENGKIYPEDIYDQMFNNEIPSETLPYPYESLSAYYARASYGQLSFSSGGVYRCTLSKNRSEYEGCDSGEQDLIREVLELLDEEIDYNDYDSDGDGCVDGIYINFAGENTGWGSTWWSHKYKFTDADFTLDGQTFGGYVFLETGSDYADGCRTIIHESGHMLGLPDYYASPYGNCPGIRTTDMMNNNSGDHNGFSKWLLGWIPEENIQRVTKEDGEQDISLAPISSESLSDKKVIAVIAPEDTSIYSEYFIVQYDEPIQNNIYSDAVPENGYRVFHVDAEVNNEGTDFLYNNLYCSDPRLITALLQNEKEVYARELYLPGDVLDSDTDDSTWFFGESVSAYTGISLTNFQTGEDPSFHVAFKERKKSDGKVEFTIPSEYLPLKNNGFMKLTSNVDIYRPDNQENTPWIYLEADGVQYPLDVISLKNKRELTLSYSDYESELKPNTEYMLVVPENTFLTGEDTYNIEWKIAVQTCNFPETEIIVREENDWMQKSNIVSADQQKAFRATFVTRQDNTHLGFKIHTLTDEGNLASKQISIPWPEDAEMRTIKLTPCYDGRIILSISTYQDHTLVYQLDENGDFVSGPLDLPERLVLIPFGNGVKGIIDGTNEPVGTAPEESDSNESTGVAVYTIDFENGVACNTVDALYSPNIFPLDRDYYALAGKDYEVYENTVLIYNHADELVCRLTDLPEDYSFGDIAAVGKQEDNYYVWYAFQYASSPFASVRCAVYDSSGVLINDMDFASFYTESYQDIHSSWELQKGEWGYVLYKTLEDSNSVCLFMDNQMKLFSELILTGNNNTGIPLGSRYAYIYHTAEEVVYALTSKMADSPDDPEDPTPGDPETPASGDPTPEAPKKPEPGNTDKPAGNKTENSKKGSSVSPADSVKTGDQPIYPWILLLIISGLGIVIGSKYLLEQ